MPVTSTPSIPFFRYPHVFQQQREEITAAMMKVMERGAFILQDELVQFEQEVAKFVGSRHAIGVADGTESMILALRAAGIGSGDEVIFCSHTYIATASAIHFAGASPVPVDMRSDRCIDPDAVRKAITKRTKAIIPTQLNGRTCDMDAIMSLAKDHGLVVIEDAAQAIGAAYHGRAAGCWGDIGCLSFYPTKNLGGMGDGGMMTTNDSKLAERLKLYANHGMQPRYYHQVVGINSRLDTIQAAVLNVKLDHLATYTQKRRDNAAKYLEMFDHSGLTQELGLPYRDPAAYHVWNQFSLRVQGGRRDALRQHLTAQQIGSEIYYPVPLHRQQCFTSLGYAEGSLPETELATREILHIPVYPEMTSSEQQRVVEGIAAFYREGHYRRAA